MDYYVITVSDKPMPVAYLWSLAFLVTHLTSFWDVLGRIPIQTSKRPKRLASAAIGMQVRISMSVRPLLLLIVNDWGPGLSYNQAMIS